MNKAELGQFFTTRANYILQGMRPPPTGSHIVEPFAGDCDLLRFLKDEYQLSLYDIDPRLPEIIRRDTLLDPPDYSKSYVITNPPFLARNKSASKVHFDAFQQNDLYKCFIETIIRDPPLGGILVLPLNFWSTIRARDIDLRRRFLHEFAVLQVNVFEEQVFEDTGYAICSFQFERGADIQEPIPFWIYPRGERYLFSLKTYSIGGDIYFLKQSPLIKVDRLTRLNEGSAAATNIKLYALDMNSKNRIRLEIADKYVDRSAKLSDRTFATLVIEPVLTTEQQALLVLKFNRGLERRRQRYNSLFLSNYREGNRKRISFGLVYKIVNFILQLVLRGSTALPLRGN